MRSLISIVMRSLISIRQSIGPSIGRASVKSKEKIDIFNHIGIREGVESRYHAILLLSNEGASLAI